MGKTQVTLCVKVFPRKIQAHKLALTRQKSYLWQQTEVQVQALSLSREVTLSKSLQFSQFPHMLFGGNKVNHFIYQDETKSLFQSGAGEGSLNSSWASWWGMHQFKYYNGFPYFSTSVVMTLKWPWFPSSPPLGAVSRHQESAASICFANHSIFPFFLQCECPAGVPLRQTQAHCLQQA